jgi:uncharacterized protein (DUF2141 family)
MKNAILPLLLLLPLFSARAESPSSTLRFVIAGFDGTNVGRVRCALFDEADWLETEERLRGVLGEVDGDQVVCVFEDLEPGRYATVAFHDENGNEKLDRNFLGIPSEPYCFSRGASGGMGPPSFEDAAVEVGAGVSKTSCAL